MSRKSPTCSFRLIVSITYNNEIHLQFDWLAFEIYLFQFVHVVLHSIGFAHISTFFPGKPFVTIDHIIKWWLFGVVWSFCCLLVKSIEFQFQLVGRLKRTFKTDIHRSAMFCQHWNWIDQYIPSLGRERITLTAALNCSSIDIFLGTV